MGREGGGEQQRQGDPDYDPILGAELFDPVFHRFFRGISKGVTFASNRQTVLTLFESILIFIDQSDFL